MHWIIMLCNGIPWLAWEWLKKHGNKDLVGKIWYTLSSWIHCQKLYFAIAFIGYAVQLKVLFPKSLVLNILPISFDLRYGMVGIVT